MLFGFSESNLLRKCESQVLSVCLLLTSAAHLFQILGPRIPRHGCCIFGAIALCEPLWCGVFLFSPGPSACLAAALLACCASASDQTNKYQRPTNAINVDMKPSARAHHNAQQTQTLAPQQTAVVLLPSRATATPTPHTSTERRTMARSTRSSPRSQISDSSPQPPPARSRKVSHTADIVAVFF